MVKKKRAFIVFKIAKDRPALLIPTYVGRYVVGK